MPCAGSRSPCTGSCEHPARRTRRRAHLGRCVARSEQPEVDPVRDHTRRRLPARASSAERAPGATRRGRRRAAASVRTAPPCAASSPPSVDAQRGIGVEVRTRSTALQPALGVEGVRAVAGVEPFVVHRHHGRLMRRVRQNAQVEVAAVEVVEVQHVRRLRRQARAGGAKPGSGSPPGLAGRRPGRRDRGVRANGATGRRRSARRRLPSPCQPHGEARVVPTCSVRAVEESETTSAPPPVSDELTWRTDVIARERRPRAPARPRRTVRAGARA